MMNRDDTRRLVTCPKCEGYGSIFDSHLSMDSRECDLCKGVGEVSLRLALHEMELQERLQSLRDDYYQNINKILEQAAREREDMENLNE
jgi:hypothetical protein